MAIQKSKRNDVLAIHAGVYAACFIPWGFTFVLLTFTSHFLTDYFTSRLTSKLWFIQLGNQYSTNLFDWAKVEPRKRHWFFVVIGCDQLAHFITLAITYKLLFGA